MLLSDCAFRSDLIVSVCRDISGIHPICDETERRTVFFRLNLLALTAFIASFFFKFNAIDASLCALNFCLSVTNAWSNAESRIFLLNSLSGTCLYNRCLALRSSKNRVFMRLLWTDCFGVLSQTKRMGSVGGRGVPSMWLSGKFLSLSICIARRKCARIACYTYLSTPTTKVK